jgi:hypothetical protein
LVIRYDQSLASQLKICRIFLANSIEVLKKKDFDLFFAIDHFNSPIFELLIQLKLSLSSNTSTLVLTSSRIEKLSPYFGFKVRLKLTVSQVQRRLCGFTFGMI